MFVHFQHGGSKPEVVISHHLRWYVCQQCATTGYAIGGDLVQKFGGGRDGATAEIFCRPPKCEIWGTAGDSLSLGTKFGLSITVYRRCI